MRTVLPSPWPVTGSTSDFLLWPSIDRPPAHRAARSMDSIARSKHWSQNWASLVTSGLIFYRDANGRIDSVDRERFATLSAQGEITTDTRVFDPTVTTLREWRARFELNAEDSWHARLMPKKQ